MFGEPVMGRDLDALDTAVRAAIAETFRALVPLVPAEVEAIRAEERERCAVVCDEACVRLAEGAARDREEGESLGDGSLAYRSDIRHHASRQSGALAARIRALGPVQP